MDIASEPKRRTRLAPQERRAQLIECAVAAFAEHGVARATHAHVAERATVSIATVHAYFRTRDDLVRCVLEAVEHFLFEIADETLAADQPVYDALSGLAQRFADAAVSHTDLIKVWLDWSTAVRADIWPTYLSVLERLQAMALDVLKRGRNEGLIEPRKDLDAAASIFLGGGHTVALMHFAGARPEQVSQVCEQLVRDAMGIPLHTLPYRPMK